MSGAFYFAIVIGGLVILSSVEVDAQSTVEYSVSCEPSMLDEAVNMMKGNLKDVKFIREDLRDVKNYLSSNKLQQINSSCVSKEDLITALAPFQQPSSSSAVDTSTLCEYRIHLSLSFNYTRANIVYIISICIMNNN